MTQLMNDHLKSSLDRTFAITLDLSIGELQSQSLFVSTKFTGI